MTVYEISNMAVYRIIDYLDDTLTDVVTSAVVKGGRTMIFHTYQLEALLQIEKADKNGHRYLNAVKSLCDGDSGTISGPADYSLHGFIFNDRETAAASAWRDFVTSATTANSAVITLATKSNTNLCNWTHAAFASFYTPIDETIVTTSEDEEKDDEDPPVVF